MVDYPVDARCGHALTPHAACDGSGCSGCENGFLPWCWAGCYASCTPANNDRSESDG